MSAIGPKQTWAGALHMSAFGGKADITVASRYDPDLLPVLAKVADYSQYYAPSVVAHCDCLDKGAAGLYEAVHTADKFILIFRALDRAIEGAPLSPANCHRVAPTWCGHPAQ
jgi:hypothetical protein